VDFHIPRRVLADVSNLLINSNIKVVLLVGHSSRKFVLVFDINDVKLDLSSTVRWLINRDYWCSQFLKMPL
jgi:hypothetical protein